MRIERIRVRNFRAFKDVEIREVPRLAIFVGANGTGKSTLFSIFGFLRDAMNTNVRMGPVQTWRKPGLRRSKEPQLERPYRNRDEIPHRPGKPAGDVLRGNR